LVYLVVIGYFFPFNLLYQEKIWQPWSHLDNYLPHNKNAVIYKTRIWKKFCAAHICRTTDLILFCVAHICRTTDLILFCAAHYLLPIVLRQI
jgi:hypothetical protein